MGIPIRLAGARGDESKAKSLCGIKRGLIHHRFDDANRPNHPRGGNNDFIRRGGNGIGRRSRPPIGESDNPLTCRPGTGSHLAGELKAAVDVSTRGVDSKDDAITTFSACHCLVEAFVDIVIGVPAGVRVLDEGSVDIDNSPAAFYQNTTSPGHTHRRHFEIMPP